MKKMRLVFSNSICALILGLCICLSGCVKNSELNEYSDILKPEKLEIEKRYGIDLEYPSVEFGVLKFENDEHIFNYLDQLNSIEADGTDENIDEIFNDIESNLEYTSYRSTIFDFFNSEEGFDEESILPVPKYNVLSFQSALNNAFEIISGDVYYNYSQDNYGIIIHNYTEDGIGLVRDLIAEGFAEYDIVNTLNDAEISAEIVFDNGQGGLNKKQIISSNNSTIAFQYDHEFGTDCKLGTTYMIKKVGATHGSTNGILNSLYAGNYIIDWGDGTNPEGWTRTSNSILVGGYSTQHFYVGFGTRTITISFDGTGYGNGTATTSFTINIVQGCGPSGGKANSNDKYQTIGGKDYRMYTTLWSDNNFWSKAIGASTYFFKKKNGNYKPCKGDKIFSKVEGNTTDAFCNGSNYQYDDRNRTNKKSARSREGIGSDYSYFTIEGGYSVKEDGVTITHSLTLTTCI